MRLRRRLRLRLRLRSRRLLPLPRRRLRRSGLLLLLLDLLWLLLLLLRAAAGETERESALRSRFLPPLRASFLSAGEREREMLALAAGDLLLLRLLGDGSSGLMLLLRLLGLAESLRAIPWLLLLGGEQQQQQSLWWNEGEPALLNKEPSLMLAVIATVCTKHSLSVCSELPPDLAAAVVCRRCVL